jgi:CRISPR-associated protein Csy1
MNEVKLVMSAFINERKQAALKKAKTDSEITAAEQKHDFDVWLATAAGKAGQIQLATHVAKFAHPDSKAASLISTGNKNAKNYIGTHCLAEPLIDATGNAAALDVYGLLTQQAKSQPLWELALVDDPDFVEAVGADAAEAFKRVVRDGSEIDFYQKQIYWCDGDTEVLLSPLTSSSLSHSLYQRIAEDRYSDKTKESWKARRENRESTPITVFPKLAALQIGGSKPQVISALNSKRGGKQYMLACLPPAMRKRYNAPTGTSCFKHFEANNQAPVLALKFYLIAQQGKPMNYEHRNLRDEKAINLIHAFVDYAENLRQYSDWRAAAKLNPVEMQFIETGRYDEAMAKIFAHQVNHWIGSPRRKATKDDFDLWVKLFKQEVR